MSKIISKQDITGSYEQWTSVINNNGLTLVPTDTVYGLLADATSQKAVNKLIKFKSRPAGQPISVFVTDLSMAEEYVQISDQHKKMLKKLLPGPYTIVLPSKGKVANGIESEKSTLGIRIPDSNLVLELVRRLGRPVTATSANLSGQSPHYSVEAFLNNTAQKRQNMIDLIIDAGKLPLNKPSTVIDLTNAEVKILRPGSGKVFDSGNVFDNEDVKTSVSEDETGTIAQELLNEVHEKLNDKPVVMMLYGDVGAGKTVFVRSIGAELGIDRVVSPTFVIFYEYTVDAPDYPHVKNLYHFDLYRIKEKKEFKHLGIPDLLKSGNLVCIEWSEKSDEIIDIIKDKAYVVHVQIVHGDKPDDPRIITIA